MDRVQTIRDINDCLQGHLQQTYLQFLHAEEASQLVYRAEILNPGEKGPPDAKGFAFRQYLRDLRDTIGYGALFQLMGAKQKDNKKQGRWTIHKIDKPGEQTILELLQTKISTSPGGNGTASVDYLTENLDVVFVGTSAGKISTDDGKYYAHPKNQFWDLVNASLLVDEWIGAENCRFVLEGKCGLTDLVKKKASGSDALLDAPDIDREGFLEKMKQYQPSIIAFNGKRAFQEVFQYTPKEYGLTREQIDESQVFLLPSSNGSETTMTFEEKLEWYKKLKALL